MKQVKRVLLINPPESKQDGFFNPPLGLLYLAGNLRRAGVDVVVLDGCLDGWPAISRRIEEYKPHIIGVTCLTVQRKAALKVARVAKEIDPTMLTVLGGPHPTIMDRQILTHYSFVDVIVRGEGEETIVDLAQGVPVVEIAGVSWRRNGEVVRNRLRPSIENLDTIPFPAWDLVDIARYPARGEGLVNGINLAQVPRVSVIFSRGCTGRCYFCSSWWVWRGWRARSAGNMADEIELLYQDLGVQHFCFADDTMTVNRVEVVRLCQEIVNRHLKIAFHLTTRVDCVDEEMLRWLKEAGCYEIAYGIETASQRLLDAMGKGVEWDRAAKAVEMTTKAGIATTALLIVGNVGESVETMNETIDWLVRTAPKSVGTVGGLWILPGTKLCARAKRLGLLNDEFWLGDEPYLLYTSEHTKNRLRLFTTALELRQDLIKPLWLNIPRYALLRFTRRVKRLGFRLGTFLRNGVRRTISVARRSWARSAEVHCKRILLRLVDDPYRIKENYITANPHVTWWEQHLNSRVIIEASPILSGRIADFGCNHGACTILMAQNAERVIGIDRNKKALMIANILKRQQSFDVQQKLQFVCARLTELPFANSSLDGGFIIDVVEHLYDTDIITFFSELKRVIKRGSKVQVVTPFEHAYDDGFQHVSFFNISSLTQLMSDFGMKILKIERDRRPDFHTPQGHDRINVLLGVE